MDTVSNPNPIILQENSRRMKPSKGTKSFYLTRVKVKVVRIARRVKIKYVIKVILPVPVGLSSAGEGAAGPLSHCSGNDISSGWEFADCFYIWEIPEDHNFKDQ